MASSSASSENDTLLDNDEAPPARRGWDRVPAAAPGCAVMGDEELWPPLRCSKVTTAAAAAEAKAKAPASSTPPAAPEQATKAASTSRAILGSSSSRHGDRTMPAPERHAGAPSSSSSQPMHTSNNNVNNGGAGFRGRQNNGRFGPHPQGQIGGGGYNNGNRRPGSGANNGRGRGDVNFHVHVNVDGHGNDISRGGGFNNNDLHRGGRSHPNGHRHGQGHRPSGSQQMARMEPRHHGYPHLPPPPPPAFMGMAPMLPYYDPYAAYGPFAFSSEFAAPGYYFPPPQEGLPFMAYPPLPMHMMPPHWEQQDAAFGPSPSMEEQAPQQHASASPTAEELQQSIRAQIEFYFSPINLGTDVYLQAHMDNNGWVPLSVIAEFRRVKEKSSDLDFIMTSLLPSDELEVEEGNVRKHIGWEDYIVPHQEPEAIAYEAAQAITHDN